MKATDLRIGNLVWDNYSGEMIVSAIDGDYVSLRKTLNLPEGSYKIDGIHSLKLTEEWLLKFGFEKKSPTGFYFDKERFSINLPDIYYKNMDIGIKLEYVHSLQNLYFALTGNELTIKQ
jgi:hypothetical protein